MFYEIEFDGYQAYFAYRPLLQEILRTASEEAGETYYIALDEAVCNAASYHLDGIEKGAICVQVQGDEKLLSTAVYARTKPFDWLAYREDLRRLAKACGEKVWGEVLKEETGGRGIWYMLSGCDCVICDKSGRSVKLNLLRGGGIRSGEPEKMRNLLWKLYIEDKGLIL